MTDLQTVRKLLVEGKWDEAADIASNLKKLTEARVIPARERQLKQDVSKAFSADPELIFRLHRYLADDKKSVRIVFFAVRKVVHVQDDRLAVLLLRLIKQATRDSAKREKMFSFSYPASEQERQLLEEVYSQLETKSEANQGSIVRNLMNSVLLNPTPEGLEYCFERSFRNPNMRQPGVLVDGQMGRLLVQNMGWPRAMESVEEWLRKRLSKDDRFLAAFIFRLLGAGYLTANGDKKTPISGRLAETRDSLEDYPFSYQLFVKGSEELSPEYQSRFAFPFY